MEQTFILIKPDGYKRRLVGTIISRFEQKGFTLTSMKLMKACDKIVDQHYIEHVSQPWYENFKSFFKSGNVIAMVWSGKNVILEARKIIGSTNPIDAAMGTIRGDLGVDKGRNLVHGSDSAEAAKREIKLWFGDDVEYTKSYDYDLLYEK